MNRPELLEQLLGIRQQVRNIAAQVTYLIDAISQEPIERSEAEQQTSSRLPKRFGTMDEVLDGNDKE